MIPKTIHWCWFGPNKPTKLSNHCINTWHVCNPEYEIKKWTESNCQELFEIPFFKKAIEKKMWAFASDYARLWVLYKFGGIYLDTDMEVIKPLDLFLNNKCFFGKEDNIHISAGVIGAEKGSKVIKSVLDYYNNSNGSFINIPMVLTSVINKIDDSVTIYEPSFFYPYNPNDNSSLAQFTYHSVKENTFAIHHWEKKWKLNFYQRLVRKWNRRNL
ncbi:glycosyltransferase family 32 protein [Photobacterium leiognathi]|uniref:glycosyltransferase family 32 protein n=1 Tax=Photobacterium leiognathi TaxID=553611 RepID=UPI0029823F40|nr:glycosyltransferase [Photobacterium leiognathi]